MIQSSPETRTLEIHPVPIGHFFQKGARTMGGHLESVATSVLLAAIGDAAELGYNTLHIAGEDPLQCPAFHSLCDGAHRAGMYTTIGIQQNSITRRLMEELQGSVDRLGVTLNGRPGTRGRPRKCLRLQSAADLAIPVEIIFRLSRLNLADLEVAAQFAVEHGATAVVVRAPNLPLNDLASAWMVVEFLRDFWRGRMEIRFEGPNRYHLPVDMEGLQHWHARLWQASRTISNLVTPLVIDIRGEVLPLRANFPRRFALGYLGHHTLPQLAERWISETSAEFAQVYSFALARAEAGGGITDFFDLLSEEAGRSRATVLAAAG